MSITPTHSQPPSGELQDDEDPTFHRTSDELSTLSSHVELERAKFAAGLISLLAPVVQEMDTRVVAVKQSQVELNKEIERLLAELQLFLNNTEPPSLQPAIIKLANARRRLTNANNILKNVHERVERLYAQLGKKPSVEG